MRRYDYHSFENSLPNYSSTESPSESPSNRGRSSTVNYDSTSSGIEVYDNLDGASSIQLAKIPCNCNCSRFFYFLLLLYEG